jgi:hypothetical protein
MVIYLVPCIVSHRSDLSMKVVFCAVQLKRVRCVRDGVCECASSGVDGSGADICPVRLKALDVVLNG